MNFNLVPEAVCIIDKADLSIKEANCKFSCTIAPITKFKGLNFLENFIRKEEHSRFQVALGSVQVAFTKDNILKFCISELICFLPCWQEEKNPVNHESQDEDPWRNTPIIHDCQTLVLGSRHVSSQFSYRQCCWPPNFRNDYPIWRRFDWALSYDVSSGSIILSGRMISVVSAEKEASEKVTLQHLTICKRTKKIK